MSTVYLIQGFLGAGKTTHSKKLAAWTDAEYLNADHWCLKNCSAEEIRQDWDRCFGRAVSALLSTMASLVKDGQDVILDLGFWDRASRDRVRGMAERLGAHLCHHYVFAPDAILRQRIARRRGTVAERNLERFDELRSRFEEPGRDEPHRRIDAWDDAPSVSRR